MAILRKYLEEARAARSGQSLFKIDHYVNSAGSTLELSSSASACNRPLVHARNKGLEQVRLIVPVVSDEATVTPA